MTEPYDSNRYDVHTRGGGYTLAQAVALAQRWAAEHGGRAIVYRRREARWLKRRVILSFDGGPPR